MGLEPIHKSVFGLSLILHSARFAFNAINQVAAFAGNVFLEAEFSTSVVAFNSATIIYERTVGAFFAFTYISVLAVGDRLFRFICFLYFRSN